MYIIKDTNGSIIAVSDTLDYQENGNPLINDGSMAIAFVLVGGVEESDTLPDGWQKDERGFYSEIPHAGDGEMEEGDNITWASLVAVIEEGVNAVE